MTEIKCLVEWWDDVRTQELAIELAMSFIQASVRIGLPENLAKIPRTVGGLR